MPNQGREWVTAGEVRGIVLEENKTVHEEIREAFSKQNAMLERQNVLLDKIADGAQAQILSATILHGNVTLGLKGSIPHLLERVTALECSVDKDRVLANERHAQNSVRFDKYEASQHRIYRLIARMFRWATTSGDGTIDYRKVTAIGSLVGMVVHFFLVYCSWINIKMAIAKLSGLFR